MGLNKNTLIISIVTVTTFFASAFLASSYYHDKSENVKLATLNEIRVSQADYNRLQSIYGIFIEFDEQNRKYTGRQVKDGKQYDITYDCNTNTEISRIEVSQEQLAKEDAERKAWAEQHPIKYISKETHGNLTNLVTEDGRVWVLGQNNVQ